MKTKILPAGKLIEYILARRDRNNNPRQQPTVLWRGSRHSFEPLLKAQRPCHVIGGAEFQAVRHNRRHSTHFIHCFSETQEVVERALHTVIELTEKLVLAGLSRDAMSFVWYEHPQNIGSHTHGGALRTLMPVGGCCDPAPSRELVFKFDRLLSRHLGLSDRRMSHGDALPAMSAWASWKDDRSAIIQSVNRRAKHDVHDGRLRFHNQYLKLLAQEGLTILAQPGDDHLARLTREGELFSEHLPADAGIPRYDGSVTTRTRDGRIIVFTGPACRTNFDGQDWSRSVKRWDADYEQFNLNPRSTYTRFQALLRKRIERQQSFLPEGMEDRPRVMLEDFAMLDPETYTPPEFAKQAYETDVAQPDSVAALEHPFDCECDPGDGFEPDITDAEVLPPYLCEPPHASAPVNGASGRPAAPPIKSTTEPAHGRKMSETLQELGGWLLPKSRGIFSRHRDGQVAPNTPAKPPTPGPAISMSTRRDIPGAATAITPEAKLPAATLPGLRRIPPMLKDKRRRKELELEIAMKIACGENWESPPMAEEILATKVKAQPGGGTGMKPSTNRGGPETLSGPDL